jgi:hypothetical protein
MQSQYDAMTKCRQSNQSLSFIVLICAVFLFWARWEAEKETKVRDAILIVGEDEMLSYTRAELLREWEPATTGPIDAPEAIRARPYDLLIFCQTVREATAKKLIAQANELNPGVKVLAISDQGSERRLGSPTFTVELHNPARLRTVVAKLLASDRASR